MQNNSVYPLDYPVEKVVHTTFLKFSINNIMITLFHSANIFVSLYDETDVILDSLILDMSGEAYDLWNSDAYLVEWVRLQIQTMYARI